MLQFREVFITPSLAKELLQSNTKNRKIKIPVVKKYANEITSNRWRTNTAEVIKISKTNVILDGQHRLHAIVMADKGINMHVVNNLEDDVFDVLDTGSARTAFDVFHINGSKYASVLPGIIQNFKLLERGMGLQSQTYNKLTSSQLLELYELNPAYWNIIAGMTMKWYAGFSKILKPAIIGGLYSIFLKVSDCSDAEKFMDELCHGKEFTNDTIIWLRKKLIEDKISKSKLPQTVKIALIIKAWNLYRQGKQVKSLKLTDEIEKII